MSLPILDNMGSFGYPMCMREDQLGCHHVAVPLPFFDPFLLLPSLISVVWQLINQETKLFQPRN